MSGVYSMTSGPTYTGATPQDLMQDALDQPLSLFSTLEQSAKTGVLDSFGLGTFIKDKMLPEEAPTQAGSPRIVPNGQGGFTYKRETPDEMVQRRTAMGALTEDQYKASAFYRKDIPWDAGMTEARASALADFHDAKQSRDYFTQKRPIAAFIGNLGGQAVDPINYIPVVGEAVKAGQIARFGYVGGRLLTGAADAALNTGIAAVATSGERAKFGDDVSWQATLSQMAMAALIGGAFGTVHGALEGRGARVEATARADAESRLSTLQTTQEARIALNEGIDALVRGEDVNLSPNATEPMQRVANEVSGPARPSIPAIEPPVPEGFVRVYHSGSVGDGDSGRWVSTNRQYAADYRPDLPLHYLDVPADDPRVTNADIPEQGVQQGFTFNFETTPKEAAKLKEVSRAGLPADLTTEPLAKGTEAARATIPNDSSLNRTASWVIRDKETKAPIMETFNPALLEKLNTANYEAVPIGQHLGELNNRPTPAVDTSKPVPEPLAAGHKQAEASVAKPEDTKALADQYRVDPKTGAFPEEADVAQLASEGRLTEDDVATLAQAHADFETADAYADALKSVAGCLI